MRRLICVKTTIGLVLLAVSTLLSSCSGLTFTDPQQGGDDIKKGELMLSFNRTKSGAGFSDTNSYTLRVVMSNGTKVYEGHYGKRPEPFKLDAGSYNVKVFSSVMGVPRFDSPCYADSMTVLIEEGKRCTLSFLCTQVNSGIRVGFSSAFKDRFAHYIAEIEDSRGSAEYAYTESRYLYVTPGEVTVRLKGTGGAGTPHSGGIFIVSKYLKAREMFSLNLHSSGSDTSGGTPKSQSQIVTGIVTDTSTIRIDEHITVGEARDGSTIQRALLPQDLSSFVGAKGVWVCGYIAGTLTSAALISSPPFESETNIAIGSKRGESAKSACVGISLPQGDIRVNLNLKANPLNLGRLVCLKGTVTDSYFGLKGVTSVTEAHFLD